jgi:hypothetical protein
MWAMNLGAPPWSAATITVTSLVAALAAGAPVPAAALQPVERIWQAVMAHGSDGVAVPLQSLREACGEEALCAARRLAAADPRLSLQRVEAPDSDTIRWVETRPSLGPTRRLADGRPVIAIQGFGRTVTAELQVALARLGPSIPEVVLDLRGNGGGDLGRMLKVADLLMNNMNITLHLYDKSVKKRIQFQSEKGAGAVDRLTVLVGPETASSAEILAALLRRYGGAELLGARTAGKDYLSRVVAVDQDWRLLVPAERVEVPGETLAGGLVADRPLPAVLALELGP